MVPRRIAAARQWSNEGCMAGALPSRTVTTDDRSPFALVR